MKKDHSNTLLEKSSESDHIIDEEDKKIEIDSD